jgi:hypothetical protein
LEVYPELGAFVGAVISGHEGYIKPEPEIYSHLGEVLWVIGKKNKAKSVWEQILRQDPSNIIINKTLKRLEVE